MKTLLPLIVLASLLTPFSYAQEKMGLYLDSRYGGSPLEIKSLELDVSIVGNRAVTTLDFTFQNTTNRILEGEFKFPLQNGQSVYRLALDLGGVLREASIVDKNKGREAFEQIARRKVDPALLEQTAGNLYTTTIYPIPRLGTRRVVIGIEESLRRTQDGLQYQIPLLFAGMIEDFKLTINSDHTVAPMAAFSSERLSFRKEKEQFKALLLEKQLHEGRDLAITLPNNNELSPMVSLEKDRTQGGYYFWAEIPTQESLTKTRIEPQKVTIIWDSSYSGLNRKHEKDKQMVLDFLRSSSAETIKFTTFNLEMEEPLTFSNDTNGLTRLESAIDQLRYDGATRWNSLSLKDYETDQIILVSDGIATLGAQEPELPDVPTYAINSSIEADHHFLKSLCNGTGGMYLDLSRKHSSDNSNALQYVYPTVLTSHTVEGDIEDLFYGVLTDGDTRLWTSGKLVSRNADLSFTVGVPGSHSEDLSFGLNQTRGRNLKGVVRRAWANKKFASLSQALPEDKQQAIAFAMNHRIITPLTSLIVLETVQDYITYDIEPPSDLLASWKRWAPRQAKTTFDPEAKLEKVVRLWKNRIRWYETHFRKKAVELGQSDHQQNYQLGGEPLPPPPFRPPTRPSQRGQRNRLSEPRRPGDLNVPPSRDITVTKDDEGNQVFELTPFTIEDHDDVGYMATTTLSGSRLRTNLGDVGDSIRIVTEEFLEDTGATDAAAISDTAGSGNLGNFQFGSESLASRDTQAPEPPSRSTPITQTPEPIETSPQPVALETWNPESPYYKQLADADIEELEELYFKLRKNYGNTPAFYFDTASILYQHGLTNTAVRVLTSVIDLAPGEYLYQRAVGRTLLQMQGVIYALESLQATEAHRSFEPQSYYDLGKALAANGRYQEAIEQFYHIVSMPYSARFNEIDVIALMELNRVIANHPEKVDTRFIDPRLIYAMPMDMRITLSWNTDDTDIDLIVKDPLGFKCSYDNPRTPEGGLLSRDITAGYGPEEFILKKATPGKYTIQAHFYSSQEQGKKMPSVIFAQITQNFGQTNEETEHVTLRLEEGDSVVYLGAIDHKS